MNTSEEGVKVLYTAKAHTTGGREGGASRTSDGHLDVKLTVPGAPGDGTNPEQLFAVGWSACFTSAMKLVALQKKVKLPPEVSLDAEVDLCTDAGGYFLQARLNASLPGLDREIAQEILEAAHQICPYSKATRPGNICPFASQDVSLILRFPTTGRFNLPEFGAESIKAASYFGSGW